MSKAKITDLPFTEQQQKWYDDACARIDQDRLKQLIFDLTAKHSPTGAEREASEFMVDYMNKAGIEAHYQPITDISGNCVGRLRGSGSGPSLLLYAPVDTLLEGDPAKDIPIDMIVMPMPKMNGWMRAKNLNEYSRWKIEGTT